VSEAPRIALDFAVCPAGCLTRAIGRTCLAKIWAFWLGFVFRLMSLPNGGNVRMASDIT